MTISHIAIYCRDIEACRTYYEKYFGAQSGPRYHNPAKSFTSYFLTFDSGPRLELMTTPHLTPRQTPHTGLQAGYAHLSIAVGSQAAVDRYAAMLTADGHTVLDGPRVTGDGYYELQTCDPEGNIIEITV